MIELLLKPIIWFCIKTGRVFDITGTGGPEDVYLRRYYVVQSKYFNIFIHLFLRSDRDDMHDHPWNFGTYVVRGAYAEEVPGELLSFDGDKSVHAIRTNIRSVHYNRWATRKATQLHRVKLDRELTLKDKDKATMTVCFTGKTRRDWGFVKDGKWVFWKKYLGLPDDAPTRG
jgi:hypothetical protein